MQKLLSTEEARLIAVRRAIEKFGHPQLVNIAESSVVTAYISEMLDLDLIEEVASDDNVEYWLDGLIVGLVVTRLLQADVPLDDLPKAKVEKDKQFQTGVDPKTGEVNVNKPLTYQK